jgi:hypothetical protein
VLLAVTLAPVVGVGGCAAAPAGRPPAAAPAGGGSAGAAATVQRIEIAYAGGAVTSGVARHEVPLGSTVDLVVASDVADEVHLHGYDRSSFVTAGATTTLRFVADIPGVFEVELEQRGVQLAKLQVS